MFGKIMAAVIGGAIDRRDGEGGLKGAATGVALETLLKKLGPIGWVIAGIWAIFALLFGRRRRRHSRW